MCFCVFCGVIIAQKCFPALAESTVPDNSATPGAHSHSFHSDSDLFSPEPTTLQSSSRLSPSFLASSPPTNTISVASSATAMAKSMFSIPDTWPPAIMACIQQSSEEEKKRALGPLVRNDVVRVLATQMFCYDPKPQKEFCTQVAKKLMRKYPFMVDTGKNVSDM